MVADTPVGGLQSSIEQTTVPACGSHCKSRFLTAGEELQQAAATKSTQQLLLSQLSKRPRMLREPQPTQLYTESGKVPVDTAPALGVKTCENLGL